MSYGFDDVRGGQAPAPPRLLGFSSASSLSSVPDFEGQEEHWHVCGGNGVDVRMDCDKHSEVVHRLSFGSLLTVVAKNGDSLMISSPVDGWVSLAQDDGYLLVAQGGLEMGVRWRYRVVCREGALVREALKLTSALVCTLPCHSVIEVQERVVNKQGLPRLRTSEGFISEVLNPLSGQRGPVVELMSVLRPLQFRVVLPEGAVVRRTVELASPYVTTLPCGETILVSEKRFSDHPASRCVQRLKLADGSGWISMRLNKDPPEDTSIVQFVSVSAEALPSEGAPGEAWAAHDGNVGDGDNHNLARDLERIKGSSLQDDDCCVVCLQSSRTATIVHGETGHVACCLECARVLKARGDNCPVCRVPIDRIMQHFWA